MESISTRNCRACLENIPNQGQSLSSVLKSDCLKTFTYLDAFESCSGYVVNVIEPQELCHECASELVISFRFKEKCTRTQNEMQQWLESRIKQEEEETPQIKVEVFADNISVNEIDENFDSNINGDGDQKELDENVIDKPKEKNNFDCLLCEKQYSCRKYMLQHYNIKHSEHKTADCPSCKRKVFPQLLESHLKLCRSRTKKEREGVCVRTTSKSSKNKTQEEDYKEKPFRCDLCDNGYISHKYLSHHYNYKHPEHKNILCVHCGTKQYAQFLNRHIAICTSGRKRAPKSNFVKMGLCPICGILKSKLHIETHLRDKKVEQDFYMCDICGNKMKNKASIRRHMRIIHLKIQFKCQVCSSEFRSEQILDSHLRIVHPHIKSPLMCKFCEYNTPYYACLRAHMLEHTGKPLYKCNICQKEFRSKNFFKDHMAIHSNRRSFKCDICGEGFNTKKYLDAHGKVHQEKNYECPVCLKPYSSNQLMKLHIEKKHPDYKIPPKGTIMSKSYRIKIAEKRLKQEAMRIGLDKSVVESIIVTTPPPLEEMLLIQNN